MPSSSRFKGGGEYFVLYICYFSVNDYFLVNAFFRNSVSVNVDIAPI